MDENMLNDERTGMTVDERMKADLLSSANWAKFLCIIYCVGEGLLLLFALILFIFGSSIPNMRYGAGVGVVYLIIAAIFIYPILKGFQFANGTKAACLSNNEEELARGFSGLQSVIKFMGIYSIVIMAIYVLAMIFFVFAAVAMALV